MQTYSIWGRIYGSNKTYDTFEVAQSSKNKPCQPIAIFPVNDRYSLETQKKRAQDYCDYMNKLVEAEKIAYEQNQLANILKA